MAVLHALTVQVAGDGEVLRVGDLAGRDEDGTAGTERVVGLGPGPLPVAGLRLAVADVVHRDVPGHDVERVVRWHALRPPTDHDGQLGLVVGTVHPDGQHDRGAVGTRQVLHFAKRIGDSGGGAADSAAWSR